MATERRRSAAVSGCDTGCPVALALTLAICRRTQPRAKTNIRLTTVQPAGETALPGEGEAAETVARISACTLQYCCG